MVGVFTVDEYPLFSVSHFKFEGFENVLCFNPWPLGGRGKILAVCTVPVPPHNDGGAAGRGLVDLHILLRVGGLRGKRAGGGARAQEVPV